MYETRHIQHRVNSGYISIVAHDGAIPAFWAHPEAAGVYPGLVALHDWWGLTGQMRTNVRKLAEAGFYVIAPNLFDETSPSTVEEAQALRDQLGANGPARVAATLEALRTHNKCNGSIGVIGWQMGGELAFDAAVRYDDLRAVAVFYGRPDNYIEALAADKTPLIAFYGDSDPEISPAMLNQLSHALSVSPAWGQLIIFPNAANNFCDTNSPNYHPQYAYSAWIKMLDFLTERLDMYKRLAGTRDTENKPR